jgi:hypothetical protein
MTDDIKPEMFFLRDTEGRPVPFMHLTIPLRERDANKEVRRAILEKLLKPSWFPRKVRNAIMQELGQSVASEKNRSGQWTELRLRARLEKHRAAGRKDPYSILAKETGIERNALYQRLNKQSKLTNEQRAFAKEASRPRQRRR